MNNFNSKYMVFDVETANNNQSSICQIGMAFLNENLEEDESKRVSLYIDPEEKFEYKYHTEIHGITETTIRENNAINFQTFWSKYSQYFFDNILIIHSNSFSDIHSINEAIKKYRFNENLDNAFFYDTIHILNKNNVEPQSRKLGVICKELGIEIGYCHNAMDDTLMCMNLFRYLVEKYGMPKPIKLTNNGKNSNCSKVESCKNGNVKSLILEIERTVNNFDNNSYQELKDYFLNYSYENKDKYVYNALNNLFNEYDVIEKHNKLIVKKSLFEIMDIKRKYDFFDSIDYIDFTNKIFYLTNEFKYNKKEYENMIKELGGNISNCNPDYLVIGNTLNTNNKFYYYNDKMIDAYQRKTIKKNDNKIITEDTFVKILENTYGKNNK